MRTTLVSATLFFSLIFLLHGERPVEFYNIYRNTPKVILIKPTVRFHSIFESDKQYLQLSHFNEDFVIKGSTFYNPKASSVNRVNNSGSILRYYPTLKKVSRFKIAFHKRGLNYAALVFKQPLPIPLWAESIEFWSLGNGFRHKFRVVYKDDTGKNYFLDFGKKVYYGWRRLARSIPLRQNKKIPFAKRYRKLWITKFLILDDNASRNKTSLYHIAALAASRIKRSLKTQQESWSFKRVYNFQKNNISGLRTKLFGYTNQSITAVPYTTKLSNRFSSEYLKISAKRTSWGFKKLLIRFKKPIRVEICRKIVLSIKGEGRREKVYILIRNVLKQYYLIYAGTIRYTGWAKLYVNIPRWIPQKTKDLVENKGLYILELMVVPSKERLFNKLSIGFDNLGVVEDSRHPFFPGREMFDYW